MRCRIYCSAFFQFLTFASEWKRWRLVIYCILFRKKAIKTERTLLFARHFFYHTHRIQRIVFLNAMGKKGSWARHVLAEYNNFCCHCLNHQNPCVSMWFICSRFNYEDFLECKRIVATFVCVIGAVFSVRLDNVQQLFDAIIPNGQDASR